MTIAFDAAAGGTVVGGSPLTVAITVGAGSNRALVVGCGCDNSSDNIGGSATCTFNGTSMGSPAITKVDGVKQFQYMWVLAAPASGTHNIVMTPTSAAVAALVAASFTGVDQSTPYDATVSAQPSAHTSPQTVSISASSGGVVVDMVGTSNSGVALTPDGTQTQAGSTQDTGFGVAAMSYKQDATAMTWTYSGNLVMTQIAVALKAAASGGGGGSTGHPQFLSLLGVA